MRFARCLQGNLLPCLHLLSALVARRLFALLAPDERVLVARLLLPCLRLLRASRRLFALLVLDAFCALFTRRLFALLALAEHVCFQGCCCLVGVAFDSVGCTVLTRCFVQLFCFRTLLLHGSLLPVVRALLFALNYTPCRYQGNVLLSSHAPRSGTKAVFIVLHVWFTCVWKATFCLICVG